MDTETTPYDATVRLLHHMPHTVSKQQNLFWFIVSSHSQCSLHGRLALKLAAVTAAVDTTRFNNKKPHASSELQRRPSKRDKVNSLSPSIKCHTGFIQTLKLAVVDKKLSEFCIHPTTAASRSHYYLVFTPTTFYYHAIHSFHKVIASVRNSVSQRQLWVMKIIIIMLACNTKTTTTDSEPDSVVSHRT